MFDSSTVTPAHESGVEASATRTFGKTWPGSFVPPGAEKPTRAEPLNVMCELQAALLGVSMLTAPELTVAMV
jgi:hypothetical protein